MNKIAKDLEVVVSVLENAQSQADFDSRVIDLLDGSEEIRAEYGIKDLSENAIKLLEFFSDCPVFNFKKIRDLLICKSIESACDFWCYFDSTYELAYVKGDVSDIVKAYESGEHFMFDESPMFADINLIPAVSVLLCNGFKEYAPKATDFALVHEDGTIANMLGLSTDSYCGRNTSFCDMSIELPKTLKTNVVIDGDACHAIFVTATETRDYTKYTKVSNIKDLYARLKAL